MIKKYSEEEIRKKACQIKKGYQQITDTYAQQLALKAFESDEKEKIGMIDLYNIYREYIKHENTLINNRISWLTTIQGFLFAAFGLIIKNGHEPIISGEKVSCFLRVIAFVGAAVSVLTFISALGAIKSIDKLEISWKSIREKDKVVLLPWPKGGGDDIAPFLGRVGSFGISSVFVCVWIFIGYTIISSLP